MGHKKKDGCPYTIEEMAGHCETVASFGKAGKPVSMYGFIAKELRRLAELDAAIERGDLVWRAEK